MKTAKDITGHRFGKWTALKLSKILPSGNHIWWCRCDCGSEIEVNKYALGKKSHQCSRCYHLPENLEGSRFGKVTAFKYRSDKGSGLWECKCDCGSIVFAQ